MRCVRGKLCEHESSVLRDLFQYFFHFEILNHQICKLVPFQLWAIFPSIFYILPLLLNFLRDLIWRVGVWESVILILYSHFTNHQQNLRYSVDWEAPLFGSVIWHLKKEEKKKKKKRLDEVQSNQNEEKRGSLEKIPWKSFSWLYSVMYNVSEKERGTETIPKNTTKKEYHFCD